jgi:hypothetical protein
MEVMAAYLNPSEQTRELRATLARLAAPDAPADEPDIGADRADVNTAHARDGQYRPADRRTS